MDVDNERRKNHRLIKPKELGKQLIAWAWTTRILDSDSDTLSPSLFLSLFLFQFHLRLATNSSSLLDFLPPCFRNSNFTTFSFVDSMSGYEFLLTRPTLFSLEPSGLWTIEPYRCRIWAHFFAKAFNRSRFVNSWSLLLWSSMKSFKLPDRNKQSSWFDAQVSRRIVVQSTASHPSFISSLFFLSLLFLSLPDSSLLTSKRVSIVSRLVSSSFHVLQRCFCVRDEGLSRVPHLFFRDFSWLSPIYLLVVTDGSYRTSRVWMGLLCEEIETWMERYSRSIRKEGTY